jgi:hypothetical protein
MQTDKLAENRRVSFHGLRKTEYIINIKFRRHCRHVHRLTIYIQRVKRLKPKFQMFKMLTLFSSILQAASWNDLDIAGTLK